MITLLNLPYRRLDSRTSHKYFSSMSDIRRVNLHKTHAGTVESIVKLADFLRKNLTLKYLNLGQTRLSLPALAMLMQHAIEKQVRFNCLNLSANNLDTHSIPHLGRLLKHTTALNINANALGSEGLALLLPYLDHAPHFQHLKIADNGIDDEGAERLIEHLRRTQRCITIDLGNNSISAGRLKQIASVLLTNKYLPEFFRAAQTGNLIALKYLAHEYKIPIDLINVRGDGGTALAYAIQNNDRSMIAYLLKQQVSLKNLNTENDDALSLAERVSNDDIQEMIGNQLDFLLLAATKEGAIDKAKEYYAMGASLFFVSEGSGNGLLHEAVLNGHPEMVNFILREELILIEEFNKDKRTALELAETLPSSPNKDIICRLIRNKRNTAPALFRNAICEGSLKELSEFLSFELGKTMLKEQGGALLRYALDQGQPEIALHLEMKLHEHDAYQETSDLSIKYSGKTLHKTVVIEGGEIHRQLQRDSLDKHQSVRLKKDATLNLVNAKISFVVSDRPHVPGGHHARRVISLDVTLPEHYSHVENFYSFKSKPGEPPRSLAFFRDVKDSISVKRDAELEDLYNQQGTANRFAREFHHSERALYAYLSQKSVLKSVAEELLRRVGHDNEVSGIKVYAMVLDLHSTHTLCPNCQESAHFWYSPQSRWSELMSSVLQEQGFTLPKTGKLAASVRVSADKRSGRAAIDQGSSAAAATQNPEYPDLNHTHKATRTVVLQSCGQASASTPGFFVNLSEDKRKKVITVNPSNLKNITL